jgi:hypothetical protein
MSYSVTELEDEDDASIAVPVPLAITVQWDIVFSKVYLVPMLCFQVWDECKSVLCDASDSFRRQRPST